MAEAPKNKFGGSRNGHFGDSAQGNKALEEHWPKKGKENLNIEQEQVSAFEPLKENINIEQEHVLGFNPLKENINSNAAVLRKQKYSKDSFLYSNVLRAKVNPPLFSASTQLK